MTTVIEEPDDATGEPFEDFTKAIKATAAMEDYEFNDATIAVINHHLNTYNNALAEQLDRDDSADKDARQQLNAIEKELSSAVSSFEAVGNNPYFTVSILDALEPTGTDDVQIDARIEDYNTCVASLRRLHEFIARANSREPTSARIPRATRGRAPDVYADAYDELSLQLQAAVTEPIIRALECNLAEIREDAKKIAPKTKSAESDAKKAESDAKEILSTLATLRNADGPVPVAEVIVELSNIVRNRRHIKATQNRLRELKRRPLITVGMDLEEFTRTERDKETGAPAGTYLRVASQLP